MLSFYLSLIESEVDQSRFATLYNKYIDETLFFAESIVRNKWDAEDVCQETWFYFSLSDLNGMDIFTDVPPPSRGEIVSLSPVLYNSI